ncbi:MAG: universal stress protein [Desulfobulbaceae bacterium]|nr:universal stress protein [Desulfobulbaceae bacterium]
MNEIKTILVPIDFSDNSEKILQGAIYMAGKLGAKMQVIFVAEDLSTYSRLAIPHTSLKQFQDEILTGAENKIAVFLEENIGDKADYMGRVLTGDISEQIIDFAAEEKIDMIIMGSHGYKGLEKVVFGSVAEHVVKNSPCPVLVINPYK